MVPGCSVNNFRAVHSALRGSIAPERPIDCTKLKLHTSINRLGEFSVTVPLYQRIAEELTGRIRVGVWPVGTQMPTEHQLMAEYGVSRNTVRSALRQLQALHMISRRRNRGTVVEGTATTGAFTQSLATLDDLVSLARTAQREVLATRTVVFDVDQARALSCPPGSKWIHIAMTRRQGDAGRPLGWTDAYVDPRYAAVRQLAKRYPERLLCDLIEAHFGRPIVSIEQHVTASAIPVELASQLQVAEGEPGLRIVRRYRDSAEVVVLITRSFHPAERYALSTVLTRARTI